MKIETLFLTIMMMVGVVAGAQSFGTGDVKPQLQNITIYDVAGLSDQQSETEGVLVDYGVNKTFKVNHNGSKTYRFSFKITNEGTENWSIKEEDIISHDGINQNWNVQKIWYNITQDYDTGTYQNGKVSWNTSKGGRLDTAGENSTLYAKYLIEISGSSTVQNQNFNVSDTSNSTGSTDEHQLSFTELGKLVLSLNDPKDNTTLQKNDLFDFNTTLECINGECGNVSATPRYNQSKTADTLIPESGTPFEVKQKVKKNCILSKNEQCNLNWNINASGGAKTEHLLDFNATSNYTEIQEKNSSDNQVEIRKLVYLDLNWNTTDYGVVEPGEKDKPAEGNLNKTYNITIPEESWTADLWIKSTNLVSSKNSSYNIHAKNMTYNIENTAATATNLSNSYQNLQTSVMPGTNVTTYYWLSAPYGIVDGKYTGTMTFKANVTQ